MSQINDAGESVDVPISETLKQRGTRYGKFSEHAQISQTLRNQILNHYATIHPGETIPAYILEAITMICHKLGRVANGDPFYDDNWRDIAGYSQLVVDILNNNEKG